MTPHFFLCLAFIFFLKKKSKSSRSGPSLKIFDPIPDYLSYTTSTKKMQQIPNYHKTHMSNPTANPLEADQL